MGKSSLALHKIISQLCQPDSRCRYIVTTNFLARLDTGVIGPVTVMPGFTATFGEISSSLHGLVVSCVLLSATFASLFSGTLSDTLGRTRVLAAGAFVFGVGSVIEASAMQLAMLILGRLIVGVGEGLFLSTLVVSVSTLFLLIGGTPCVNTMNILS